MTIDRKNTGKKKFSVDEFIKKTKNEKKNYIIAESNKIIIPNDINKRLQKAYKYKEVINRFIVEYITKLKKTESNTIGIGHNSKDNNNEILNKINQFQDNYIDKTLVEKLTQKPTNLFQMSGAKEFYKMQLVLRSLTTKMGNFWEELAILSNNTISTEKEFGLKITGVDIICLIEKKPTYIQMKTMEGTLTGSQVPRSEEELMLHQYKYFAAIFESGSNWTFNSEKITRIKGKEFWSLINLDYDYILEKVKLMIKNIEDKYIELTETKT